MRPRGWLSDSSLRECWLRVDEKRTFIVACWALKGHGQLAVGEGITSAVVDPELPVKQSEVHRLVSK